MRASCGCLIEDGMVLHNFDGPCSIPAPLGPTDEDYCAGGGHGYYGDDAGVGRCYCGKQAYPAGGPDDAPTSGLTSPCDADPASSP